MNIDLKCTHIWNTCESIAALYYNKAVALIPQIKQFEKDFEPTRDEYCLQSRYLHRGFYCPSLILEHIVDNVKRGRLAKRMTSRTNPTNGYFYDEDDIMRMTETYYPNGAFTTEYLFYEDNIVFGITCEPNYRIQMISVEKYSDNRIQSYLVAFFDHIKTDQVSHMEYQSYQYGESCLDAEWYDMNALSLLSPKYKSCRYQKYHFSTDEHGNIEKNSAIFEASHYIGPSREECKNLLISMYDKGTV